MVRAYLAGLPGACAAPMDPARTGQVFSVFLPAAGLLDAAARLLDGQWFLEDVTGHHVCEGFELDYHFAHWTTPGRITVRVMLPCEAPEAPSLSCVYPGADWHERETADFFGVTFTAHPNPMPILLPEDEPSRPLVREAKRLRPLAALLPPACLVHHPAPKEHTP